MHCLDKDNTTYNVSINLRLRGHLDIEALEKSIIMLVERHESLRTCFRLDDDQLVQIIHSQQNTPLNPKSNSQTNDYLHCYPLAGQLSDEEKQSLLNEEINRPFDLHQLPLFRCALFSSPENSENSEHLFTFTVHHNVFDHQSKSLFIEELAELYNHYAHDVSLEVRNDTPQFADYVNARREKQLTRNRDKQIKYWKKKLNNLESIDLPMDYPRPALMSGEGVRIEQEIPAEVVRAIRDLAAAQQTTFFMTTLAVCKALLSLWTGKNDIPVGTHIADRRHAGGDKTIGFLLNTLVLRTQLEPEGSLIDLLKSVQKTCFNAFRYADVPFESLVNELKTERNYQRNPFFDVRFSHLQETGNKTCFKALECEDVILHHCRARYDLTFTIRESDKRCFIQLEYRTTLFGDETAEWLLSRYLLLIRQLAEHPRTRLNQCNLIDGAIKTKLVHEYNATRRNFTPGDTLVSLVSKQVEKTPKSIALRCGGEEMSYQELDGRSGQLASYLQGKNIVQGDLVAISLARSLDIAVATLAVLKLGAAYLPIDQSYPDARIQHMVEDSGCRCIISHSWLADDLPPTDATRIWLDKEYSTIEQLALLPPNDLLSPQDIAYVIYTSGSTGRPKGVRIRHSNVTNFLNSMQVTPGITSNDRLLAVTTLSFDIAVLEIWLPLISGATSIIARTEEATDGERLRNLLESEDATLMQATPVTWRMLINADWNGSSDFKALCGGESMPQDLASDLHQRSGELWNMYGPTETTVWSSCYSITDPEAPILIGKPIANTTMYVLDAEKRLSYPGVVGELYIGGAGVAAGYHKRDDLNNEKFLQDPFRQNERIYSTGDAACMLANGNIKCLGRVDNQVKVRGHRIELGEIESRLNDHPSIRQSAVTTAEFGSDDSRIVAYLECHENTSVDNTELREWLRRDLPPFMIPQMFVTVDELPLTPNGKLDRQSLVIPELAESTQEENLAPPQTALEKSMTAIWADSLGVDTVPVNETFFNLGGHSLLAMQVISRVRKDLNIEIDPVAMAAGTVRELLFEHDKESSTLKSAADVGPRSTVETFFFCENELYARLHKPVKEERSPGAVLLCNPLFSEANNILWGYQRLATILADKGYIVLRFDYYGCGNSLGDDTDGNTVRWQSDIAAAANKLLEKSGHSSLTVLGFRYGATLAAGLEGTAVDKLILWEPVPDSNQYIDFLEQQYQNTIQYLDKLHKTKVVSCESEITGFPFTPDMRHSIETLKLIQGPLIRKCKKLYLVSNEKHTQFNELTNQLGELTNALVTHVVDDKITPIEKHDDAGTWLPGRNLNQLVDCIREEQHA